MNAEEETEERGDDFNGNDVSQDVEKNIDVWSGAAAGVPAAEPGAVVDDAKTAVDKATPGNGRASPLPFPREDQVPSWEDLSPSLDTDVLEEFGTDVSTMLREYNVDGGDDAADMWWI